jgi:hypothetical protein
VKNTALSSTVTNRLLIAAQLLALTALVLGLNFLIRTTGGTLFLFASVAPLLVMLAIVILAGVGIHRYNASHHLFEGESFSPGEVIIREGEPGICAYFIQEGQVEVLHQEQGEDRVVAMLGKDDYFGEMALLSNAPRNATVRAAKETRVAALGRDNFVKLLGVLPQTKESILRTVQARAKQAAGG